MAQQERLNRLLEFVAERGSIRIEEASDALGVSAATMRRDLNALAEQQLVVRTHGGAAVLGSGYELPLRYKLPREAAGKAAIAAYVEGLVKPGDSIALNGGTTTTEVARALGRSPRLVGAPGQVTVTLLTNAVNIAYELTVRQQFRVIVTGGVARAKSYELVGPLVNNTLLEFKVDVAFLGVDGISVSSGATTYAQEEALVARWMSENAKRVVVVADHSKLNRETLARILPIERVDALITDSGAELDLLAQFRSAGVEVVVAPD